MKIAPTFLFPKYSYFVRGQNIHSHNTEKFSLSLVLSYECTQKGDVQIIKAIVYSNIKIW